MRKILLPVCLLALSAVSCGPMNKETDKGLDGQLPHTQKIGSLAEKSLGLSKNDLFLIHTKVHTKNDQTDKPTIGNNTYQFRFVHTDLLPLSPSAEVSIMYWMPAMPAMGKIEDVLIREADGSYSVDLYYSMLGKWEVNIFVKDGETADEYVFEIEI